MPQEQANHQQAVAQDTQARGADEALGQVGQAVVAEAADEVDVLDELLDDLSSVLETNAEEYVSSFVQKGGE
ncbi:ubiquitin-like protein Pup [Bifidobacterium choloepi]|uniref:Prokaryotic ubiquitin-like protein Pup n=1 Tax=Bifidobacterium choloepi TaxID=2614131 RepID=A0A6I5MYN9_9BIFI|nr:ubiquitin-like protein Pup [Bifidobacterium choloepi]NEG69387.1 ubiquitin-like protein Pup [Bifidobacterium choloepi]